MAANNFLLLLFLSDMLLHMVAGTVVDMGAGMVADKVADMVVGMAADKKKNSWLTYCCTWWPTGWPAWSPSLPTIFLFCS